MSYSIIMHLKKSRVVVHGSKNIAMKTSLAVSKQAKKHKHIHHRKHHRHHKHSSSSHHFSHYESSN